MIAGESYSDWKDAVLFRLSEAGDIELMIDFTIYKNLNWFIF